jgi:hypothetical protein
MIALRLAAIAGTACASSIAQSPPQNWTLRQPIDGHGAAVALHPVSGRPVLCGGNNVHNANAPYFWEWTGDSWRRHTGVLGGWPVATDVGRGRMMVGSSLWDGVRMLPGVPVPSLIDGNERLVYDSVRGRVVFYNTWYSTTGIAYHRLLEWDGVAWTQLVPVVWPASRSGFGMAFHAATGKTVLFGGSAGFNPTNETWEWDGVAWTQRLPAQSPPEREQHVMAYDPQRQRVVLWGGVSPTPPNANLLDTWEWDGATWTQVATVHRPPSLGLQSNSREKTPALVYDPTRARVVLFTGKVSGAVWEYDGVDWTEVTSGALPIGRANCALVDDPVRRNTVLFGGYSHAGGFHADTWTWDGLRWARAATAVAPSARTGHAMGFDAARGEVVLFGGSGAAANLNDTWIWNGAWTQRQPANRPSPRTYTSLAFHAPSQRMVMFGGAVGNMTGPYVAETWTWDGANWQQANPTVSPSARMVTSLTGTSQDVVLFGGAIGVGQTTNPGDTWTWNGSTWTQLQPAASPPAHLFPSSAYDVHQDRVVLVTGYGFASPLLEAWAFDGATWAPVATASAPKARQSHAVAYDPRQRELVLFGGIGGAYLDGTWALGTAQAQDTFGAGCVGTRGVPLLQTSTWSRPELGGVAAFDLTNLPHALAVMAAGFSRTQSGAQPLPLSLQPFGMPGCDLRVSPDANVLVVGSGNAASWFLPVPSLPALLGVELFVQAFAFDPAANAAGVTVSNGGRCRIGH